MSQFVLAANSAPFVINSGGDEGLTVVRIDVSWPPSTDNDATRAINLNRYLGTATGDTTIDIFGTDNEDESPSAAVQGSLSTSGDLQTLHAWQFRALDYWSGENPYATWGSLITIDLSSTPVFVGQGHSLLVNMSGSDNRVNIYFEEA